jgi:hypothetical protein
VGWGYTITNADPTDWLMLTGLNSDGFLHGTALNIFDFPIVAPGSAVSQSYTGISGLFELTWDTAAPAGFTNSGTFVVSAEWYDGDPLGGGAFLGWADELTAPYSATVTTIVIPEPSSASLLLAGVSFLIWRLLRRLP